MATWWVGQYGGDIDIVAASIFARLGISLQQSCSQQLVRAFAPEDALTKLSEYCSSFLCFYLRFECQPDCVLRLSICFMCVCVLKTSKNCFFFSDPCYTQDVTRWFTSKLRRSCTLLCGVQYCMYVVHSVIRLR